MVVCLVKDISQHIKEISDGILKDGYNFFTAI